MSQGHSKNAASDEGDGIGALLAEVLAGFRDGEAGATDEGNGEVAQGGERASAGADAASVLGEGDISDVVKLVLDAPMGAGEAQQALRRGSLGRQAGDEIDDLSARLAGDLARALEAGDLGEPRPGQIGDDLAADRDPSRLDAAVALLHGLGPGHVGGRLLTGGSVAEGDGDVAMQL